MKKVALAAMATTSAAALAIVISGPALAAPQEYSYELMQVVSVGLGKVEVTVELVRTSDGAPVTDAVISASKVDMKSADGTEMTGKEVDTADKQRGRHKFLIETSSAGTWVLHLSAKVPGPLHIERMFFPSVKWTEVRKVHNSETTVAGVVSFVAH
jgi:hypothetical protein